MADRHADEVELARRLLDALGRRYFSLTPSDRPDVLAEIEGRRIGIEVTVFHADEAINHKGSALRAAEEKTARDTPGGSYTRWGIIHSLPGLSARITDKISVATAYDQTQFDELWLLIVGQFPKLGAVASTFASPIFLSLDELTQHFDEELRGSRFGRVYLHLWLDQMVYGWSRSETWRLLSGSLPQSSGSTPWFKAILDDPEWQRDPAGKARAEAHKAVDELLERRRRENNGE